MPKRNRPAFIYNVMASLAKAYQVYVSNLMETVTTQADLNATTIKVANRAAEMNRERLRNGDNPNGSKFQGYTHKYGLVRARRGLALSPVDLFVNGDLYDGIHGVPGKAVRNQGEFTANFRLDVTDAMRPRTKGLTSGRLGKGRRQPRQVLGLYSAATSQGKSQRKELSRMMIAGIHAGAKARGVTVDL